MLAHDPFHGIPVARLTVTKSSVRTSTIDERMITKYWPEQHQRERADRQHHVLGDVRRLARTTSSKSAPGVTCWPAGNSGSQTANSRIRMIPIQYSGAA